MSGGRLAVPVLGCLLVLAASATAQDREERTRELLAMENPLPPADSVWIEELTWLEVRDRIRAGATTAIVPTGGVEQNGPYLTTGKHNVILEALCPAIARELGNALCAPIVPFVPEGDIEPPTGAMRFPGTISVRDETFHALLADIASSLKQHGFTDIVLIGDSGGNQRGMEAVAGDLNARWKESGARVHFVGEFYTPGWEVTMEYSEKELGVKETRNDGHHDDIWVTAMMMVTDPATVRYDQRVAAGLASINGIDLRPKDEIVRIGEQMVAYRARYTADVIREKIAAR
jgi:creatinine amidohydrolase/Fe(II)-dependent formamide hydrolase-like protein